MRALKNFDEEPFMSYRAGLTTNEKYLTDNFNSISFRQASNIIF